MLFIGFEIALKELLNKKSEGIDGIPGELLKALGRSGKQELFQICCEIYESGEWSTDFLELTMIPTEEKQGA